LHDLKSVLNLDPVVIEAVDHHTLILDERAVDIYRVNDSNHPYNLHEHSRPNHSYAYHFSHRAVFIQQLGESLKEGLPCSWCDEDLPHPPV